MLFFLLALATQSSEPGPRRDRVERVDLISAPSACPFLTLSMVCLRWQSFSLACTRDCLFVRNRLNPIAFEKGNAGIPSVVTRIVQVECE